jgi:hypothetical protein
MGRLSGAAREGTARREWTLKKKQILEIGRSSVRKVSQVLMSEWRWNGRWFHKKLVRCRLGGMPSAVGTQVRLPIPWKPML